jgi:hypothetical protein
MYTNQQNKALPAYQDSVFYGRARVAFIQDLALRYVIAPPNGWASQYPELNKVVNSQPLYKDPRGRFVICQVHD